MDGYYDGEKIGLEKGLEQGLEKGEKIGLEKGLEKGTVLGKLETARNLLKCGFALETIANITALSIDFLKENIDIEMTEEV